MIDIIQKFWSYLLMGSFPEGPIGGLAMTIMISVVSLILAIPVSLLIALCRTSRHKGLIWFATIYVYAMRGLPLLFLLLWVYLLVPLIVGAPISPFWSVVIAIVVYQGAYLSEVIRGGILALPTGQTDAALSLGLSRRLIVWKVILPQAIYNVVPGIVNQFTIIVKESSLGYVIALGELTYVAGRVNALLMTEALSVYAILALIYFILCFSLSRLVALLERRIRLRRTRDADPLPIPSEDSVVFVEKDRPDPRITPNSA
ncbi:amino acid ABC transporter permease [Tropicimonas sp. IMCC34043]|uniref:amino acid ABC transporter permease n=1 Tax=Tropicimonas sp. IMCC34043 TaxID=2248760 RepID=UPI000E240D97|nr:amino acid ABC transporter permease [Tropicimonas sp. IMCC34043]